MAIWRPSDKTSPNMAFNITLASWNIISDYLECFTYLCHIILMYYLNYELTGLKCKQFARCYSSLYLSITANEPEVSPIDLFHIEEKGG